MTSDVFSEIADSAGVISPAKLSVLLHIRMKDLARLASVHRTTLQRNPGSRRIQERLAMIGRILNTAASITGDLSRAIIWFKFDPIDNFDGKTPIELVHEGHSEAVMDYLDLVDNGVYS